MEQTTEMNNLLKHRFNDAVRKKDVFLLQDILRKNMFDMTPGEIKKVQEYIQKIKDYYTNKSELLGYAIDIFPIDQKK